MRNDLEKPKETLSRSLTKSGVVAIARHFSPLDAPWEKEGIPDYLGQIDHSLKIADKRAYEAALQAEEKTLNMLVRRMPKTKRALVVVLQGRDGAGKTGACRRIEEALGFDYKIFASVPIIAPDFEELRHGFLWRFTRHERWPSFGEVRIFDRSWCERLLVESVMKLTPKEEIKESYAQIRLFERLWTDQGMIIVKLWLDITREEQKARFKKRKQEKLWKITDSDAIAREHWDDYTPQANEMFHRTGADFAPWHLVSSEDKYYSRVTVLRVINNALQKSVAEADV